LVNKGPNAQGLQYCTNCRTLFVAAPQRKTPPWIFGVLAILLAHWQIICHR
jgi:hypothetical protein